MNPGADNPQPKAQPPRMHHRARSHESAHAEAADGGDRQLFKHPMVAAGPAEMIVAGSELNRLLEGLRAAGSFAFDTEFIGEQSYIPKLCLIQVALPTRVALIDPLRGLDVTPFWELVCDPSVEKVVHAGQQDVEPTFRLLGKTAENLFDTQVAAGFIGLPYPLSLSKLIYEMVGAKLGKGLTFTSWDQRPLSGQQARYAADDVRYLPAARQELRQRLERAGHAAWAAAESNEMCKSAACRFDPDENYLKIRGAGTLEGRNLSVLRELAIWRDATARQTDVPPRTLLKDEVMLLLARSPARSIERLSRVRGLPRSVESDHGAGIVAATMKALSLPDGEHPQFPQVEPPPREKFKGDSLWAAAQSWCFAQGIDPAIVASRQEITDLRRSVLAGAQGGDLPVMQGWRREALGGKLVELIQQDGQRGS
jgi:ribonuclease D